MLTEHGGDTGGCSYREADARLVNCKSESPVCFSFSHHEIGGFAFVDDSIGSFFPLRVSFAGTASMNPQQKNR